MLTLPRTERELWNVFCGGRTPQPSEFRGDYAVHMLTRMPSLRLLSHRKVFIASEGKVTGRNVLFRNLAWGRFFLEEAALPGSEGPKVVVINYDTPENSFLTRGIRDYVRAVEGTRLYLGRFNVVIGGKPRFLGYFSLEKIG